LSVSEADGSFITSRKSLAIASSSSGLTPLDFLLIVHRQVRALLFLTNQADGQHGQWQQHRLDPPTFSDSHATTGISTHCSELLQSDLTFDSRNKIFCGTVPSSALSFKKLFICCIKLEYV